ncbi:hypothetical protein V7147_24635 [Bacillus sp. JJ1521]|uniref:hypothetical protein n=1 Tax=Bacillus sp. JJ1521 TaxID=3122957 RepID=UPI002FFD667F
MFSRGTKITTLFWIAILGVVLTTIYTLVIMIQGSKTMKMIRYIYNQTRNVGNKKIAGNDPRDFRLLFDFKSKSLFFECFSKLSNGSWTDPV